MRGVRGQLPRAIWSGGDLCLDEVRERKPAHSSDHKQNTRTWSSLPAGDWRHWRTSEERDGADSGAACGTKFERRDQSPGRCLRRRGIVRNGKRELGRTRGGAGCGLVIAGIYTGVHIGRGWVAADDGTLSQSALRVMHVQPPHRDFGEIYTGRSNFYSCAGLSGVRRKSDFAPHLRVSVFSGLAPSCLVRCATFYFCACSGSDHTAGGRVELSELSGGDAFLVQPVFRDVWGGDFAALLGSTHPAMAVCSRSMRRTVDPDEGHRGIPHCRGAAVLAVRATQSFAIVSGIWFSVAALTPLAVLLGAMVVWARRKPDERTKVARQQGCC